MPSSSLSLSSYSSWLLLAPDEVACRLSCERPRCDKRRLRRAWEACRTRRPVVTISSVLVEERDEDEGCDESSIQDSRGSDVSVRCSEDRLASIQVREMEIGHEPSDVWRKMLADGRSSTAARCGRRCETSPGPSAPCLEDAMTLAMSLGRMRGCSGTRSELRYYAREIDY